MTALDYPRRIDLAYAPTPLVHCKRMSDHLGIEFWLKRDDMTGVELSGNKVRKLEFLLADAIDKGADTVITGGGEQSNHCRATALAAAKLGLKARLLLRTQTPSSPPPIAGNILLDRMAGAEIVWVDHPTWANRQQVFADHANELRSEGRVPYVIPEGGSNAMGSWGYIRCAEELGEQLSGHAATTVVYACGSGGTGAGLIVGAKTLHWSARNLSVAGVNVCDDAAYFTRAIQNIASDYADVPGLDSDLSEAEIDIIDGYVGGGYAKSSPQELEVAATFARLEGVIVDPVYTGKALFAIASELKKNRDRFGDRIVFLHTGGIFGVFPKAELYSDVVKTTSS